MVLLWNQWLSIIIENGIQLPCAKTHQIRTAEFGGLPPFYSDNSEVQNLNRFVCHAPSGFSMVSYQIMNFPSSHLLSTVISSRTSRIHIRINIIHSLIHSSRIRLHYFIHHWFVSRRRLRYRFLLTHNPHSPPHHDHTSIKLDLDWIGFLELNLELQQLGFGVGSCLVAE